MKMKANVMRDFDSLDICFYCPAELRPDGEVRSHASWMTHCDRLRTTNNAFRKWLENHSPEYSERHFHLN